MTFQPLTAMRALRDSDLSRNAKAVGHALLLRANSEGHCWAKLETISEDTGLGRTAVVTGLKALREGSPLPFYMRRQRGPSKYYWGAAATEAEAEDRRRREPHSVPLESRNATKPHSDIVGMRPSYLPHSVSLESRNAATEVPPENCPSNKPPSSPPSRSDPKPPEPDEVAEVWATFLEARKARWPDSHRLALSQARRGHVKARLREFGRERVEQAIAKFFDRRSFWGGCTASQRAELLWRSEDQLAKVLAFDPAERAQRAPPRGLGAQASGAVSRLRKHWHTTPPENVESLF